MEQASMFSAEVGRAKTSAWLDAVLDWLVSDQGCSARSFASLMNSVPPGFCLRTSLGFCRPTEVEITPPSSHRWGNSGMAWPGGCLTLDSSGVPQRRRRVIFVGHPRIERAVEVLFEPESCGGHPAASGEPGEGVAGALGTRAPGARWDGEGLGSLTALAETCGPLTVPSGGHRLGVDEVAGGQVVLSPPLLASMANNAGSGTTQDAYTEAVGLAILGQQTHALTAEGHDASEDGTGRGTPIVMAPSFSKRPGQQIATRDDGVSFAVTTGEPPRVLHARQDPISSEVSLPLDTDGASLAVFAQNQRNEVRIRPEVGAIPAQPGSKQQDYLAQGATLRRLTPLECERLQGFDDGWTEGQADSTRYRQLGNSVAVPVFSWVANRLVSGG